MRQRRIKPILTAGLVILAAAALVAAWELRRWQLLSRDARDCFLVIFECSDKQMLAQFQQAAARRGFIVRTEEVSIQHFPFRRITTIKAHRKSDAFGVPVRWYTREIVLECALF